MTATDQLLAELERLERLVGENKTQADVIRKAMDLLKVTAEIEAKAGAPEVVMHPIKPKTLPVDEATKEAIKEAVWKKWTPACPSKLKAGDNQYMAALEDENWDLNRANKALWAFIQEQGRVITRKAQTEEHLLQLDNAGVVALEALDRGLSLVARLVRGEPPRGAGGYRDYVDVPELMSKARDALRGALAIGNPQYRKKSGEILDKGQGDGDSLREADQETEG